MLPFHDWDTFAALTGLDKKDKPKKIGVLRGLQLKRKVLTNSESHEMQKLGFNVQVNPKVSCYSSMYQLLQCCCM